MRMLRMLFCLLVMLCVATAGIAAEKAPVEKPDPLAFKMVGLDGKEEMASKILRGKPSLLVFAQSACGACRDELGMLTMLSQEFKGKFAFRVVMVDLNASGPGIQKYLDDLGVPFAAFMDPKFLVASKFGVTFTPATVVLDSKGETVKFFRGYEPGYKDLIASALKEAK